MFSKRNSKFLWVFFRLILHLPCLIKDAIVQDVLVDETGTQVTKAGTLDIVDVRSFWQVRVISKVLGSYDK